MKSLVIVAFVVSAVSAGAILEKLKSSFEKIHIPAERQTKYLHAIEQFGKPCLEEVKTHNPHLDVEATLEKIFPAIDSCIDKVKDIPADKEAERKSHFKECLKEKYDAADEHLSDEEKKGFKEARECIKSAIKKAKGEH